MRILVAPDKFKGSLGAAAVAEAIAAGVRDILPDADITMLPIADGGEGTAEVICSAADGEWHTCEVHDPLGRVVNARYCTIAKGASAVMEMSTASGLWRLRENERDPLIASSSGTGEMLLDAARRGAKEIILGLGGSATNDGGFGMARALGFRFVDAAGCDLPLRVPELLRLAQIKPPPTLDLPAITAAVDVQNPLLGDRGATRVFGPQKGARPDDVELLEHALTHLADVAAGLCDDHRELPGSGAAGGLGFALCTFCDATIRSGFNVVAERIGLEAAVQSSDVVITAEGRLDLQTLEGKAPAGVARLARARGKLVVAVVGASSDDKDAEQLFDAVFALTARAAPGEDPLHDPRPLLRRTATESTKWLLHRLR